MGTDLLFAVPVALAPGLTYAIAGLLNFSLVANLLLGGIPGVILGSISARRTRAPVSVVFVTVALVTAAVLLHFSQTIDYSYPNVGRKNLLVELRFMSHDLPAELVGSKAISPRHETSG